MTEPLADRLGRAVSHVVCRNDPTIVERELAIVPLLDIHLHEECDEERVRLLASKVESDLLQRNPIVLGRAQERSLVHLDGATRIRVLQRLGCEHAVAQIVGYQGESAVSLETWSHITRLDYSSLQFISGLPECSLEKVSGDDALSGLAEQRFVAAIAFANGDGFGLAYKAPIDRKLELLKALLCSYGMPPVREIAPSIGQHETIQAIVDRHPPANAIISFVRFGKDAVVEAALRGGQLFPPGITRHVINCSRILNVGAPLALLRAALPLPEKERQLSAMLSTRQRRVYAEATIHFET